MPLSNVARARREQWLASAILANGPRGGLLDDAPHLKAAYDAGAAQGRMVVIPDGDYTWSSPHELPRTGQLVVWGSPRVSITSTLPGDGLEANAPFNSNPVPPGAATTLAAPPVVGSYTLAVVDASTTPVDSYIRVETVAPTLRLATYRVAARDLGLNTLTVDRPIRRSFTTGDLVTPWFPLNSFRLYGNGMRLSGTGDRGIEIVGGWECWVDDVLVDGAFTDFVAGFDLGSTKCGFSRMRVRGNGAAAACMAFENSELCTVRTAWMQDTHPIAGVAGLLLPGAVDQTIEDVHAWHCINGVWLAINDPTNLQGCFSVRFRGCSFNGNVSEGILVSDGSTDVDIVDCEASFNGQNGLRVTATGPGTNGVAPDRIHAHGLRCEGNVGFGVSVDSASRVGIDEPSLTNNTNGAQAIAGARVELVGGQVDGAGGGLLYSSGAGSEMTARGTRIASTSTGNVVLVQTDTDATLALDDVRIEKGAAGVLMQALSGATISARKVRTVGGAYPALLDAGGVLRLDAESDLAGGSVPQVRIYVLAAGVFEATAPQLASIAIVPLIVGGVMYLTWAQWAAGVVQFTTGAAVAATTVAVPPIRSRQRVLNSSAVAVTIVAVDGSGTPIGAGPTLAPAAVAELIFDGTNVVQL